MEILSPGFLRIALDVALVLTAMSALVLAVTVAVRLQTLAAARRALAFRHEVEPSVTAYLAGREKSPAVIARLLRDPSLALALLMEISDRLEPADHIFFHMDHCGPKGHMVTCSQIGRSPPQSPLRCQRTVAEYIK